MLLLALLVAFSVNAVQLTDKIADYDGIVSCGENPTGSTSNRFQRFGNPAPDAVYMFSLGYGTSVTVDSCGSNFDTWLRIFDADGVEELCQCDDCGECGLQSVLTCDLPAGHYLIVVDGYAELSGDFDLLVSCAPSVIPCGETVTGFTTRQGNSVGNPAGDVFYSFTLNSQSTIVADSCGSGFDTWLSVWTSDMATELCGCDDCGDCGLQSIITCDLPAGEYVLVVDGFSNSEGDFSVSLSCPRASIQCDGTAAGFTNGAANNVGNAAGDVLYDFVFDSNVDLTLNSCASGFDTWLRVLSPDLATEFCECDDCGDCGLQTVLDCGLDAGSYVVAVDGFSDSEGVFEISASCADPVLPPYNPSCENDNSCPVICGPNEFTLSVSETAHYTFDTCGAEFDTIIYIYARSVDGERGDLVCSCDDCGDCGLQTELSCTLLPGEYLYSVGAYGDADVGCFQPNYFARTFPTLSGGNATAE